MTRTRIERPFIRRLNKIKRLALAIEARAKQEPKEPHDINSVQDFNEWIDSVRYGLFMSALSTLRKRTIKQSGQAQWDFMEYLLSDSVTIRHMLKTYDDLRYHPKYGNKIVTKVNGKTESILPLVRPTS